MAERRMFAKTIVTSDAFLDMPLSTRCLYFTLAMFADDDGFVNNPKSIMRQVGASMDDLNILIAKRFILTFESGVIVIKHWKIHNYIAKDRYKETKYLEEKNKLSVDSNGAYTECIQDVYRLETQVSIGKARLGEEREGELSVVEDSTTATSTNETEKEENTFRLWGGSLGKGVVMLTDQQEGMLLDELGIDGFDYYVEKLADFIIEKKAKVANHYATIMKWAREDAKV